MRNLWLLISAVSVFTLCFLAVEGYAGDAYRVYVTCRGSNEISVSGKMNKDEFLNMKEL